MHVIWGSLATGQKSPPHSLARPTAATWIASAGPHHEMIELFTLDFEGFCKLVAFLPCCHRCEGWKGREDLGTLRQAHRAEIEILGHWGVEEKRINQGSAIGDRQRRTIPTKDPSSAGGVSWGMRLFYLQLRSFCLRFVFFTYGRGTVSKKDQTQYPGQGEP